MTFHHVVIFISQFIFVIDALSASLSRETTTAPLSSTLPVPRITPGENACETFKSLFGLTYTQMRAKHANHSMLKVNRITREESMEYINDTKAAQSIFKRAKNIVILMHGFTESSDGAMVQSLAKEYLIKPEVELFAVDGRDALGTGYFTSTTHVRFLGEELGWFLSDIINNGANASKVTIVGHSLGAHIAGVAGRVVHQRTGVLVGRITGLDPAKPCFSHVHPDGRLDLTDAMFVDVVHSNGGFLGLVEPVGHVDFYPNGGMLQPGCILPGCHHSRAWELYSEAINLAELFPGRKCESWTKFQNGGCANNELAYMGAVPGTINPGNYYLTTAEAQPYGLGVSGCG